MDFFCFFCLKKGGKKNLRVFTSQRRSVCHWFSALRPSLSFLTLSPQQVSIHPDNRQMMNSLDSTSDRDAVPRRYHWGLRLYIRYRAVRKWCSSPRREKGLWKSLMGWSSKLKKKAIMAQESKQLHGRVPDLPVSRGRRGVQWAMTVCFPVT